MSSGGGGSSQTVTKQELSPEQRQLLNLAMPGLTDYAKADIKQYPGSAVTPFNKTQLAARDELANQAWGTVKPLATGAAGATQSLTTGGTKGGMAGAGTSLGAADASFGTLSDIFKGYDQGASGRKFLESGALLNPNTNPVLKQQTAAAVRPIRQELMQEVMPGIRSNYVGNNMFGSSRQGIAEGMAMEEFLKQAQDATTELQMNAFDQGLGAMLSSLNKSQDTASSGVGAGLDAGSAATGNLFNAALEALTRTPSIAELSFLPGMTLEGIGQSQQGMDQALLNEKVNRYTSEQMLPFLKAQDIANLAFGMGGGSAVASSKQEQAFDPMQTAIGAGMGGLTLMKLLPMLAML